MGKYVAAVCVLLPAMNCVAQVSFEEILDPMGDGSSSFESAGGVGVAPGRTVFISDIDEVFRVDPDGSVAVAMDSSGNGTQPVTSLGAVVADRSGNVYVAEAGVPGRVYRIDAAGMVTVHLSETANGESSGMIGNIRRLVVAPNGDLLVPSPNDAQLYRVEADGSTTAVIQYVMGALPVGPYDVVVDSDGRLIITTSAALIDPLIGTGTADGFGDNLVVAFIPGMDGTASVADAVLVANMVPAPAPASDVGLGDISIDSTGVIYVARRLPFDNGMEREVLYRISPDGEISDGYPPDLVSLLEPKAALGQVEVGADDAVYVAQIAFIGSQGNIEIVLPGATVASATISPSDYGYVLDPPIFTTLAVEGDYLYTGSVDSVGEVLLTEDIFIDGFEVR